MSFLFLCSLLSRIRTHTHNFSSRHLRFMHHGPHSNGLHLASTLPNSTSSRYSKKAHNMQWFPLYYETIKSYFFYIWWFLNWCLICHVMLSVNFEAFRHDDLSKAHVEINEISRDHTNLCSAPVKPPVITLFTWHMTSGPNGAAFMSVTMCCAYSL